MREEILDVFFSRNNISVSWRHQLYGIMTDHSNVRAMRSEHLTNSKLGKNAINSGDKNAIFIDEKLEKFGTKNEIFRAKKQRKISGEKVVYFFLVFLGKISSQNQLIF